MTILGAEPAGRLSHMPRLGALAPFRIRSYRFQWPADLLTSWAFEMETLILGWYVLVETNSVLMLTLYGALLYGGTLIAPMVGVWSDRIGHRNMLSAMRAVYALVAATLMVLAFTGTLRPTLVLVLAAVTGIVRPSDMGLRGALIADTMPADTLTAAMGISRTTSDYRAHRRRAYRRWPVRGHRHRAELCGDHGLLCPGRDPDLERSAGEIPGSGAAPAQAAVPTAWKNPRPGANCARDIVLVWNTPRLLAIVWYALLFNFAVFPLTNGLLPYAAKEIYRIDQTGLGLPGRERRLRRVRRLDRR